MDTSEIDRLAKIIWDYHHLNQTPKKADCILVLGNYDRYLAQRAADLYKEGYAPLVIFTGDRGKITRQILDRPEAEILAKEGEKLGIPKEKVSIENKSTNTRQNIEFARDLIKEKTLNINSFLVVSVPCMERRAYATFKVCWPDIDFTVTSPQISFEQDVSKNVFPHDLMINLIVGYLQRIKIYAEKGFQILQEIPAEVWRAYEELIKIGFNKHLVEE